MYIKRTAEEMILSVSKSFPSIVVYGPRQVGKTTMVTQALEQIDIPHLFFSAALLSILL